VVSLTNISYVSIVWIYIKNEYKMLRCKSLSVNGSKKRVQDFHCPS
jgi:hypothetical protein